MNNFIKRLLGGKAQAAIGLFAAFSLTIDAQVSPEEHSKHHPDEEGNSSKGSSLTEQPGGGMMGGGMGKMMGGMMEKMGAPKPKDLYPSLMAFPDLPMEKRTEVQQQARERMFSGTALMSMGLDQLSKATSSENFAAMQDAVAKLREGISQFDSGLAAHRALAEGKAPRNVAIQWFKSEMNLLPPQSPSIVQIYGGSTFHLTIIVILSGFVIVMLWMYFFKMRRASALLQQFASTGGGSTSSDVISSQLAVKPNVEEKSSPLEPPKFPVMKSRTEPVQKWTGKLRVCQIFQETPDVKTFQLAAEHDIGLPFSYFPGQFLTLTLKIDGKKTKRSYTIASTPTQSHYCAITVKREEQGLVSRFLHDKIKEGDLLEVAAATGKFTFTGEEAKSIVLIGGGVGITPMMGVIRYLTDIGWHGDIFLIYCCRTVQEFIFREELEHLQERHPNLHVFATMTRTTGSVWMGLKGRLKANIIDHLVPEISTRRIHVCGPPTMMSAVLTMLKELGVPEELVKTEAFGPAKKPAVSRPVAEAEEGSPVITETKSPFVTFKKTGKSENISIDQTILELAEAKGVDIDSSCRSGQCGLCKVKLLSGKVTMECDDSLSEEEKQQGLVLACQAKPSENVEVDA